ncbi:Prenylcysteine lyase-domain-containing protein [Crassisporium funariophilum]|nr:Prenylcysteine lyase-domain-containing protein [Crassisporium funariophilum]
MRWSLSTALLLLPSTLAFEFPFNLANFFKPTNIVGAITHTEHVPASTTPRIAIIGAGAGGSSAAFWIFQAKNRFGIDVKVDVYESRNYIGGRSTVVYPYDNTSLPELELGASIFVEANKNLWRASNEFNLTRRNFQNENMDYETGIWDGETFLLSFKGGWWDTAKLLWRYGFLSPKRTETFVRNMIDTFLSLYTKDAPKWDSMSTLASALGWTELLNSTTSTYLVSQGISEKYVNEVVEAATRVNYGQNADYIHALEGACSMAATGATGIAGGNFQIFEKFLNASGANVYLDTHVTSVTSESSSSSPWSVRTDLGTQDYKAIILAAPLHSTGIKLPSHLSEQIPEQPYIHLHVTLLSTTSPMPNPAYFGLSTSSQVPRMILTSNQGAREGRTKPEFNSLSYHGLVREGEWAVKIFSDNVLSDEWLNTMFQGQVGWVHRKEWDAYPKLPPTTEFPPVKLDQGFYYVNAFEPFISTMETETIASRNVVDLLLHDEFDSGLCGARTIDVESDIQLSQQQVFQNTNTNTSKNPDFILGWDC